MHETKTHTHTQKHAHTRDYQDREAIKTRVLTAARTRGWSAWHVRYPTRRDDSPRLSLAPLPIDTTASTRISHPPTPNYFLSPPSHPNKRFVHEVWSSLHSGLIKGRQGVPRYWHIDGQVFFGRSLRVQVVTNGTVLVRGWRGRHPARCPHHTKWRLHARAIHTRSMVVQRWMVVCL